ncbi:MAG TPA: hypothetical protein VN253_18360 [Kofleriaceae bacterium]|nr:hypothetical protein [Kofleriaceae bacterium]
MSLVRTSLAAGLALLAQLVLPRAAGADVTVASHAGDTLLLHRASADKIDKLYEERGKGVVAYAFTDAKTLWVLRKAGAGYTIGKVVDSKAEAARPVTLQMATPGNEVPSGFDVTPGLIATKSGQVLVTTCLQIADKANADGTMACELGYTRVDDGSSAFGKTRPKDVVFVFGTTKTPRPTPLKKPPKGYTVKITRTKLKSGQTYTGYTCTGPDGKLKTWPTESDQVLEAVMTPAVNKATWLSESPAVVHIEANGVSPVKEKLYQEWFVVDCSTELTSVRALRDGLWLTDDTLRKPTGEVIGKLPGDAFVLAP